MSKIVDQLVPAGTTLLVFILIGTLALTISEDRRIERLVLEGVHPVLAACAVRNCTQAQWHAAKYIAEEQQ